MMFQFSPGRICDRSLEGNQGVIEVTEVETYLRKANVKWAMKKALVSCLGYIGDIRGLY